MINLLKADGRRLKLLVSVNLLSLENINPSTAGPELPPPTATRAPLNSPELFLLPVLGQHKCFICIFDRTQAHDARRLAINHRHARDSELMKTVPLKAIC